MAITLIQSKGGARTDGANLTVTFDVAASVNNLIIVTSVIVGTANSPSFTDPAANAYVSAGHANAPGSAARVDISFVKQNVSNTALAITMVPPALVSQSSMSISEWTGAAANPLDTTNGGNASAVSSLSVAATMAAANELLIGAFHLIGSTAGLADTTGDTNLYAQPTVGNGATQDVEWRIAGGGSQSVGWSWSNPGTAVAFIASFTSGGVVTPQTTPPLLCPILWDGTQYFEDNG